MTLLTRSGVVAHDADGRLGVAFASERCAGCDGRCGLRLGRTRTLPLPTVGAVAPPVGTRLDVVVARNQLNRQAAFVFGVPLAVAASAAMLADWAVWHPLWALGATAAGLGLPLAAWLRRRAEPVAVLRQGHGGRIELWC